MDNLDHSSSESVASGCLLPKSGSLTKIFIRDLRTRCIIGVNEDERREKQDIVINIVFWADLSKAGKSDNFEDTIDYRAIKRRILSMVEDSHFFLVEALAEHISEVCLEDDRIEQVQITVEKPSALRFAKSVGVEIIRGRS